jgi:hypothetical protein
MSVNVNLLDEGVADTLGSISAQCGIRTRVFPINARDRAGMLITRYFDQLFQRTRHTPTMDNDLGRVSFHILVDQQFDPQAGSAASISSILEQRAHSPRTHAHLSTS